MSNKIGFIQKLRICWFMLTNPSHKYIQIVSCEFCNSTNVYVRDKQFSTTESDTKLTKNYTAKYLCMNCKSECEVTQNWTKIKPEVFEKIKKQIKNH